MTEITGGNGNALTARVFDAINGTLLDIFAAIARDEDRRRRQAQG